MHTFAPRGASLRIPLNPPLSSASIIDLLKFNPGSVMFEDTGIDGLVDASGTTATATGIASLPTFAYASSNVVVVGTSLPIDTTSLLLAGASVNVWMIPVVLSAAGFGILIARKIWVLTNLQQTNSRYSFSYYGKIIRKWEALPF